MIKLKKNLFGLIPLIQNNSHESELIQINTDLFPN